MRFRATLKEPFSFTNVLQALEKLGQSCVIHFQPDIVSFYMTSHFSQSGRAFVELATKSIFEDYRIESKSNNEIPMVVNIPNIARAIRSGINADKIVMKLTKKSNRAFLTFDITENVNIIQDVPVTLQPIKRMKEFYEPELPDPEVQIRMPELKALKNVIDRMKSVSDILTIEASLTGELVFEVNTDMVTIKTYYKGLSIKPTASQPDTNSANRASARMSIKKFSRLLHCRCLNASYILGCIVEDHAFVVYIKLREDRGQMTYYVPLIADED